MNCGEFENLKKTNSTVYYYFFQSFMCPLMGLSQDASMFFSSFSIVLIAVDRFLYICEPHKKQISAKMVSMNKNRSVTFIHSFIRIYISAGLHILNFGLCYSLHIGITSLFLNQGHAIKAWIILL